MKVLDKMDNVFLVIDPITRISFLSVDHIPSPSIKNDCMEKPSIMITSSKPVYS